MPDITMCKGGKCPDRKKCYRYMAKPDPLWQSYFVEPPYNKKGCDMFWDYKAERIK